MDTACTRYRNELSALIDGQLDVKTEADVQGHLNQCANCSDELETLKKLTKFLCAELKSDDMPMPDIWKGISEQMGTVCEVMREDLSAYLDGELTPAAQEGVNAHLKQCPDCLGSFTQLNAANRLVSKGLELPASFKVDLWPAVKAQLNEDCALIRSEISAYVDQEVATLRHRNITNHLIDCQDCRVQYTQLSSVSDIVRDAYKPEFPENFDLWPGIKEKMQVVPFVAKDSGATNQGNSVVAMKSRRSRWIAAGVAAAVVGLTGLVYTVTLPKVAQNETISSEAYLIESSLVEPSDIAEAATYEQQ
jgi:anti-sigma factor RsiW